VLAGLIFILLTLAASVQVSNPAVVGRIGPIVRRWAARSGRRRGAGTAPSGNAEQPPVRSRGPPGRGRLCRQVDGRKR